VRLAPGWRLDAAHAGFVAKGARVELPATLPAGCEARPHAPVLAAKTDAQLSAPERELARWVQVLLPAGARSNTRVRKLLEALDCVEEVMEPPQVGLP
jgi:hypothetical protein